METLTSRLLTLSDADRLRLGVACTALVASAVAFNRWRLNRSLPPGPVSLPLLGCPATNDQSQWHRTLAELGREYGGIFSFYYGTQLVVVVTDFEIMKEMLEGQNFIGRYVTPIVKKANENCGIGAAEGASWQHHRRMSLRILREFGFARIETVNMVDTAMENVFDSLDAESASGKPVNVLDQLLAVSNGVVAQLVFGRVFNRSDEKFAEFCDNVAKFFNIPSLSVLDKYPVLYYILMQMPNLFEGRFDVAQRMRKFVNSVIDERKVAMSNESAQPMCLCDVYIREKEKAEAKGDFETYKDKQISSVCLEFFFAGTDTTARSVEFLMLYIAFHSEVQKNVQKELDDVVGRNRLPRLSDKPNLHFTCAVIDEAYRKTSLAAVGALHRATKDTVVHGYKVPKDAIVIPHVQAVHNDPTYWDRPDEFRPERFLDSQGRYKSSPRVVPFLIGKRSCPGESLARMEIFLMATQLLQRYEVRPSADSLNRREEILAGRFVSGMLAVPYGLVFSRR